MKALLTVKAAAEALACSPSFVYDLVAERRIVFVRLGKGQGGIRITEEAIEEYLQRQTVGIAVEGEVPTDPKQQPIRLRGEGIELW